MNADAIVDRLDRLILESVPTAAKVAKYGGMHATRGGR